MSLTAPAIPPNVSSALESGLGDFVPVGSNVWHLLLHSYKAHAVYNLNQDRLPPAWNAGDPAPALDQNTTVPNGWRFLASYAGQIGACHISPGNGNAAPKVTGFSDEPEIADVVEAIGEVEKSAQAKPESYELRVLRITWLRRELFWLRSNTVHFVVPYFGFKDARKLRLRNWAEDYWPNTISQELAAIRANPPATLLSHT